jgi:hypothetical protein
MKAISHTFNLKVTKAFAFAFLLVFLAFSATAGSIGPRTTVRAAGAWVNTDKQDYSPEETVIINGGGFLPEAVITVRLTRPNSVVDTWHVGSDEGGGFTTSYQLDGITGTYLVSASDGENTATMTFTDTSVNIYATTGGTVSYAYTDSNGDPQSGTVSAGGSIHVGAKKDTTFTLDPTPLPGCSFTGWTGDHTGTEDPYSWTVGTGTESITAHFTTPPPTEHTVSFAQTGCGAGYNPTVEYWIDAGSHTTDTVPFTVQVDDGHQISYAYQEIVPGAAGVRYVRTDVSPASPQIVTADFTVTGTYGTQYQITVTASPAEALGGTFAVTYTQGGTTHTDEEHSTSWTGWADASTDVTVSSPQDYVPSAAGSDGVRYHFHSYNPDATVTMTEAKTIALAYDTQYYLTVVTDPAAVTTPSGEGWYNDGETPMISTDQYVVIVAGSSRYRFDGWTTDDMTEIDKPAETSTTVSMDKAKTVTANYVVQYCVTFAQTGLDISASGTVVTVDSHPRTYNVLPFSDYFDSGYLLEYSYEISVGCATPHEQFWLQGVTGPSSPITVTAPVTVTGHYLKLPLSQLPVRDGNFRLIFTQDPLDISDYRLTASNPGQFQYTIFCVGVPGDAVTLHITIPYPFVTQGAVPIHLYSHVDSHFVPYGGVGGFTIDPLAFPTPDPSGSSTTATISGNIPSSGLLVVTIHLDYGLKKESYHLGTGNKAVHDPTDHTKDIKDNGDYEFSFSDGVSDKLTIHNVNIFKHDPGFAGLITDSQGTPVQGVKVQIIGPTGTLLATVYTDEDGFYFFYYKATGKAATYTVKLPVYGKSASVTVKPNAIVQVNFTLP